MTAQIEGRHDDHRHQRDPPVPEKAEDHHRGKAEPDQNRLLDRVDRGADQLGLVVPLVKVDRFRLRFHECGEAGCDRRREAQRVGIVLLIDVEGYRRAPIVIDQ